MQEYNNNRPQENNRWGVRNASENGINGVNSNTTSGPSPHMINNNSSNQNSPSSSLLNDMYTQITSLTSQFSKFSSDSDKKIESINIKMALQLQLLNDRLSTLEQRFDSLHNGFFDIKKDAVVESNDNIQKKLQLIGKHMADLSSDITHLNDQNANVGPGTGQVLGPGSGMGSGIGSGMGHGIGPGSGPVPVPALGTGPGTTNIPSVDSTGSSTHSAPVTNPAPLSTTVDPVPGSIPHTLSDSAHQTLAGTNAVDSSSQIQAKGLSSMYRSTTNAQANSDNNILDINKQLSKSFGIRSPAIGSPYSSSRMGFDFPMLSRNMSFNKQFQNDDGSNSDNSGTSGANAGASGSNDNSVPSVNGTNEPHISMNNDIDDVNDSKRQKISSDDVLLPLAPLVDDNGGTTDLSNAVNDSVSEFANGGGGGGSGSGSGGDNGSGSGTSSGKGSGNPSSSIPQHPQVSSTSNFDIISSNDSLTQELTTTNYESVTKGRKSSKSSESSDNFSPGGDGSKSSKNYDAPQFKLEKGARNVAEIWREYEYGVNGKPPLKYLELKFNAKWRNDTELRTFVRRKKIYKAIETGKKKGYTEEQIIDDLENSRNYYSNGTVKKKPLLWLYTNIPEKYA